MKTLLINPPFHRLMGLEQDYVPLSLLAVGSAWGSKDNQVFVKNLEVGGPTRYEGYSERTSQFSEYLGAIKDDTHPIWQELESVLNEIEPDTVGISVMNAKYHSALKIIDLIWKWRPVNIIVGGHHPTMYPKAYPSKKVKVYTGEFESRGGRLESLDDLPFPNYHMLLDSYSPNGYARIMTARGCPFNCKFCASSCMWGKKVTYKSIDRVLTEMKFIEGRYHCDQFTIWDETFTANSKRLNEFCDNYDLDSYWRCNTRADVLHLDTLKKMKDAKCNQMSLGIESGRDHILKMIGKGETTKDYQKAVKLLNELGIQWKAYVIIGFPEETEEDIQETIRFVKSLNPFRITVSFFTPYSGTELYEECEALGLLTDLDESDPSYFSHQSPYNYFSPKIPLYRWVELRNEVVKEIDEYNTEAVKQWK